MNSTALTSRWTQLRPHPVQRALWETKARFVAVPAGRGSGKSELAKRRLVRFLPVRKSHPDPRYFFGAPTEQQAKRIGWDDIVALVPDRWVANINRSELRIRTIFGSDIYVVGMDRPQRIEGLQFDGCVLDESCDQKPKTFERTVVPMLMHRDGWCWRIGVPKRFGPSAPEYRRFFNLAVQGKLKNSAGFTWPSSDILTPDQIALARSQMDPKDAREQLDARWETVESGVFYAFDPEFNIRPVAYDQSRPIVVGSDFNVDPMCWTIGHRKPDRLEIFDELFMRNANTDSALRSLWEKYKDHQGGFEFYGDATGRSRRTSASESDYQQILNHRGFKTAGRSVHYPKGNPARIDRFAATNAMICNADGERRLFIDRRCEHLIDDLDARQYKPGLREPDDVGDIGHMTDALGYIIYRLFPIRVALDLGIQEVIIR